MLDLIQRLVDHAPPGSQLVVESDRGGPLQSLPRPELWKTRSYPPAEISVARIPEATLPDAPPSSP